jgi:galactonate dehydratase
MKIKAVKTFPYDGVFRDLIFVKVETDAGLYGWGEAGGMGRERACEATVHEIEHYLIGQDPGQIELLWNTIYRDSYRRPDDTLLNALAGVEIALWDILGKSLNVPIYKLLGGACHPRIPIYGNTWFIPQPAGSKVDIADYYGKQAADAVAKGFRHLKFDPWRHTGSDTFVPRKDARQVKAIVGAVRNAVGDDVELLIEVHGRLSPEDAIQAARDMEEFNPYWIEEPICPELSVDALARVRNAIKIPVASGERVVTKWRWAEVFEKQAVAIAQPDIIHCGGILEMKKIAAMAHAHYTAVAPHTEQGPCMVAANVHVDASTPNFLIQEFFTRDIELYEKILKDPSFPTPKDGFIELPTKPGLGIDIDEKALTRKPFTYKPGLSLGRLWDNDARILQYKNY